MVVIIQNTQKGPPGIISEVFQKAGVPFKVLHPYISSPIELTSQVTAVVSMGGEMGAYETDKYPFLRWVKTLIKDTVQRQVPYLGICLGGQLLADVLGGQVRQGTNGEIGSYTIKLTDEGASDPLFRGIPKSFDTFEWHEDCFDLPPGAIYLAKSSSCPYQAFRWQQNAYGLQFHPEVDRSIIGSWIDAEEYKEDLLTPFLKIEEKFRDTAEIIFNNFIRIITATGW